MEHKLRPFDRTLAAEGAPMMLGSDRLFALTYVAGPARCGNVMVTRPGGELALYQEDKLSMMPVVFIDNLPFYTGDSVYFNGAMKTLLGANPEYPHLLTMVGDLAYYEARQLTALPAPASQLPVKFNEKVVVIDVTQWFKNGDHPLDYAKDIPGFLNGEPHVFPAAMCKAEMLEGQVVRYYRSPALNGNTHCTRCGRTMRSHGWIDTLAGGHTVCPGDWIITKTDGERQSWHQEDFAANYKRLDDVSEVE